MEVMNVLNGMTPAKGERTKMSSNTAETKSTSLVTASGEEPKAPKKAKVSAQKPRVAPAKGKAGEKATAAKKAPKTAELANAPSRPTLGRGPRPPRSSTY